MVYKLLECLCLATHLTHKHKQQQQQQAPAFLGLSQTNSITSSTHRDLCLIMNLCSPKFYANAATAYLKHLWPCLCMWFIFSDGF